MSQSFRAYPGSYDQSNPSSKTLRLPLKVVLENPADNRCCILTTCAGYPAYFMWFYSTELFSIE